MLCCIFAMVFSDESTCSQDSNDYEDGFDYGGELIDVTEEELSTIFQVYLDDWELVDPSSQFCISSSEGRNNCWRIAIQ